MSDKKESNFKRIVSDKGSKKLLGAVGGAMAFIVGFMILSGGDEAEVMNSSVRSAPSGDGPVVGESMPENYERALIEADRQRIEEARNEGKSALPSLIGSSVEEQEPVSLELEIKAPEIVRPNVEIKKEVKPIAIPEPVKKEPPKLERPTITKAETSAPSPVVVPQTTVVRPAEPQLVERPQPVLNERLYEAYSRQMGQIVANMTAPAGSPNTAYFYTPPPTPQVAPTEVPAINGSSASRSATPVTAESALSSLGGASDEAAPQDGAVTEDASPVDLPLPGKILYAQMITEANSDQPGPIVARILQGDLAGSDLVGNFSVANNALILEFNGVSVEETMSGKPVNEFVPLRAVAVNVEHVGSGLATDVDHHMFQRVAVTFATSFISGMGNAIAMSGTVTQEDVDGNVSTTNPTLTTAQQALVATGQAAGATSGILGELYGNRPTTVKVASGTPIGVLFLQ